MELYGWFLLTALAAAILPGADFAVVTKNTVSLGRAAGQMTAIGVGTGLLFHTAAAVLGLSVIIAQSAKVFAIIQYAGAAYLFYLGAVTLLKAKHGGLRTGGCDQNDQPKPTGLRACFLQGALTNALNPKASLFYLTLLPQFVNPAHDFITQLVILGLTAVGVVACWFVLLACALNFMRTYLEKPSILVNIQRCTGLLLITFGVKLALTKL